MSTVVLDAFSKAYPFITNRIRASVFLQSDPQALVASIIDTTSGHPARTWHFPGLPRTNYGFSLDEINSFSVPVNNLALFDVVPSQVDGQLVRDDEQIKVDTTTGFTSGLSTVTFDGTLSKPNYIGWEIVPSELTGRGILEEGTDYSWDKTTGIFALLISGDILQTGTCYNIHFNPISSLVGNSYPTLRDFSCVLVTATGNILNSDFGKKYIVEPSGPYIELTLPDLSTVVQGRPLMVEIDSSSQSCVKFLKTGSNVIKFLRGNLFACGKESFSIYKFTRSPGVFEWRLSEVDGNFKNVGQLVSDDIIEPGVFNKKLLDGSSLDIFQYARLYNEFVLNLPLIQVCNYDDWSTGNNKYLYSLANSTNPSFLNKFNIPNRKDLFERNNNVGKSGDYGEQSMQDHFHLSGHEATGSSGRFIRGVQHLIEAAKGTGAGNTTVNGFASTGDVDNSSGNVYLDSETKPKNYLINKYVLV